MNNRKKTASLLAVATVVLLVWDVIVANNSAPDDTISELLRDLSHSWYSLPGILGIIMGHLFWNRPQPSYEERLRRFRFVVLPLGGIMIGRDLLNLAVPLPEVPHANLATFGIGFVIGAVWWSQAPAQDKSTDA